MSNTNYPGAIDSPYDPTTTDTLATANHHTLHGLVNDAIVAAETKLGIGSSNQTPAANQLLLGNGAGTTAWGPITPAYATGSTTGTGNFALSASPTFTGTLVAAALEVSGNATVGGTLGVTGGATVNSNPVWQYLGYAQITADFNTASTSYVDVTGLSVTVTIPAGVTKVRITAFIGHGSASVANAGLALNIYDVTASAQLNQADAATDASGDTVSMNPIAIHTPAAGSRTYKCQFKNNGNAGTVHTNSSATIPSFILVECC